MTALILAAVWMFAIPAALVTALLVGERMDRRQTGRELDAWLDRLLGPVADLEAEWELEPRQPAHERGVA